MDGINGIPASPIDMGTTIPVDWETNRYAHYVDHGTYDKYLIYEYDHMTIVNGLDACSDGNIVIHTLS